jgi:threonine synthase
MASSANLLSARAEAMEKTEKEKPVISVPSGNFGNLCAGILAYFRDFLLNILLRHATKMMLFPTI